MGAEEGADCEAQASAGVDGQAEVLSSEELENRQQLFGELERQSDEIVKDERKLIEREMEETKAVTSEMRRFSAEVMKGRKERQQSKAFVAIRGLKELERGRNCPLKRGCSRSRRVDLPC
jgi:hypothetical protein